MHRLELAFFIILQSFKDFYCKKKLNHVKLIIKDKENGINLEMGGYYLIVHFFTSHMMITWLK